MVVAVPTTPRSIELDLDGRQECELVDKFKFEDEGVLEDFRHPTVIHVVLEETHMEVENESRAELGILSRLELIEVEVNGGVCHLFVAEFWEVRGV